jgi:hypothetical protein
VIARAQQASFVIRIVREVPAALGDVKSIRENRGKSREGGFIAFAFAGRNHQIRIAGAGICRERGPARSPFLVKIGIIRDHRNFGDLVGIVHQVLGIAISAMRRELAQLPVQQRLRSRR